MPSSPTQLRALATAVALCCALPGCAQVRDWMQRTDNAGNDRVIVGAPHSDEYLQEMYELASGDPATQAEIFADSHAAATLTPDPSTRLRLALVLATPGHAESDPERAQDMLRELLAQSELLAPAEVSLATIHLRELEERIRLSQQAARLQDESAAAASSEQRAIEQRIATVEAQNRQLRQSLEEAEKKLEAITSIERSIRNQAENDNHSP